MLALVRCECGDPHVEACQAAFDSALAAEFGDPAFFAVHHLTVAAYQAQHPSRGTAGASLETLRRFLEEGVTPEQMRRATPPSSTGDDRSSPVVADNAMKLSSVRFDSPAVYCRDIERYARSVLASAMRHPRTHRCRR